MKKRVKNNSVKRSSNKKEMTIPIWLLDGFVGILSLMVYNFLLYLLTEIGIEGVIGQLEDTMGYFGLNSFIDLNFSTGAMSIGILIVFLVAFVLGAWIGGMIRKRRRKNNFN